MSTATPLSQAEAWLPSGAPTAQVNAPEWLEAAQAAALASYQTHGLPSIRDEQWRYTSLRGLKSAELAFSSAAATELPEDHPGPRLVFVNGRFQASLSSLNGIPNEVVCAPMSEALIEHGALLKTHLGATLPSLPHSFLTMNAALHTDGYVVIVPKNCNTQETIEILFLHANGAVGHTRNLILAEANSKCAIIERHLGNDGSDATYLNNCVTEIVADQNAHLEHTKLQSEAAAAFHFGGVFIQQQNHSNVTVHSLALAGNLIRNDVVANLLGEGSHVEMNGLVLGKNAMHVDNHTEVNHAVAHCTSDEFYKTILDDQSRSVFRGRIIVAQDAQQTNADQQNNNLLLSPRAEADTKPQLEIYADDVKCSHGATVGQLDAKSLFYLQSRGINPDSARALLTFAFANEVVERIQHEPVKQEVITRIAGELVSELEQVL